MGRSLNSKSIHSTEGCVHVKYNNFGEINNFFVESEDIKDGLKMFRNIFGEDIPGKFFVISVGW
jgi:hypothetical protein